MYLNSMNGFDERYKQNPFRVFELFNLLIAKTKDKSKLKSYKRIKCCAIWSIVAIIIFSIIGLIYEVFSNNHLNL